MKRLLSILTALLLVLPCCVFVAAEEAVSVDNSENISYTEKEITGPNSGNTAKVHLIEFNPENYVPMAYSGNGGSVCLAEDHVKAAVAEGYDVLGAINGSFFQMAAGAPCGTLVSDGKIVFTHLGLKNEPVATFDAEGNFKVVSSTMNATLTFDGKNISAGIGLVNKIYASISALGYSGAETKFHYYDMDGGDLGDETVKGYEIICEKDVTTELIVGKALKGKVLEVKENSNYGATEVTEKNRFVLFLKSGSNAEAQVKTLSAGSEVVVEIKEVGNKTSIEAMENAISAISSTYWLVKDGKNIAAKATQIGSHSTTLARAWTAFGVKEDGTYVFWTSSEVDAEGGNAVTLRDVAEAMMEAGCVNVVRLDGGGSTCMYVKGQDMVMSTPRKVCDVLLIVDKESLKYESLVSDPLPVEPDCTEPSVESAEESEISSAEDSEDGEGKGKFPIIPVAIGGGIVIIAVAVVLIVFKKKQ